MNPDLYANARRFAPVLLALLATAAPSPAGTAAPARGADPLATALSGRVVEVRRGERDCRDCSARAIPVPSVPPGAVPAGHCIENAVVERFQIGAARLEALAALLDVPVDDGRYVKILLLTHPPAGRPVPAVAIHPGELCVPAKLTPDVAFGPVGADKDPAAGEKRSVLDWLLGWFGADIERYAQIWVESNPVGAEIQVRGAVMQHRTNARLGVTPAQLGSVWLGYKGRRYPLAACRNQPSKRPRVAREYHCRLA